MKPITLHTFSIIFFTTIGIFLSFYFIFVLRNVLGIRHRRKHSLIGKRFSDQKILSPLEKAIKKEAMKLIEKGLVAEGAEKLIQNGFLREAVTLLESMGEIREAGNLLCAKGRFHRAGIIYSRNAYWKEAIECFEKAKMPLEAARAAEEAKLFEKAGRIYESILEHHHAVQAYTRAGNMVKAARVYGQNGYLEQAAAIYEKIILDPEQEKSFHPTREDIDNMGRIVVELFPDSKIKDYLKVNQDKIHVVDIMAHRGKKQNMEAILNEPVAASVPLSQMSQDAYARFIDLFKASKFCKNLVDEEILLLWQLGALTFLPKNTKIDIGKEEPSVLYIILEGQVEVGDKKSLISGDVFDWVSFFSEDKNKANLTYRVTSDMRSLTFTHQIFNGLVSNYSTLLQKLYKLALGQITQKSSTSGNNKLKSKPSRSA